MSEPAIKGAIFGTVVEDLVRLRDAGFISQEKLELRLSPEELAWLDAKTNPTGWYPMRSYGRLLDLVGELEGRSRDNYFRERGAGSARRLIESGLYDQLDFLGRFDDKVRGELARRRGDGSLREDVSPGLPVMIAFFKRVLRLLVSLARNIYSVGEWSVEDDPENPERVNIEIRDAAAYTDPMRYAIEGFLNECSRAVHPGITRVYTSMRPSSDRIVLRMDYDISDLYERFFS